MCACVGVCANVPRSLEENEGDIGVVLQLLFLCVPRIRERLCTVSDIHKWRGFFMCVYVFSLVNDAPDSTNAHPHKLHKNAI